jgi:uncharacterized protein YjbI with pentapeptide repeats
MFVRAKLSGTEFSGADLTGTDFTDAEGLRVAGHHNP